MVQLIKKLTNADYVALTEEIERIIKLLNVVMEPVLLSIRMLLVKVTQKIGRKKYLWLIVCWKQILGLIKLNI